MVNALVGQKINQSQRFLENGTRIPVTVLSVISPVVTQVKDTTKDGYVAVQIGFSTRKKGSKALVGHARKAGLKSAPRVLKEVRLQTTTTENVEDQLPKVGDQIKISDVFTLGDLVDVIGISKGKGFAGGVKRYHFKGGPRTHGQSDRERAPGSIGQTTTPGRVYKGKRMAGKMGFAKATVKNLRVVDITQDTIILKGLVPGSLKSFVLVVKKGIDKKFVPLIVDAQDTSADQQVAVQKENENAK